MHLVDHARSYIEQIHVRPRGERMVRWLLGAVLPYPRRFGLALRLAPLGRPLLPVLRRFAPLRPLAAMIELAPSEIASPASVPTVHIAERKGRVALLQGCAEPVLRPEFRAAAVRLLERCGHEVIFAAGEGCCGALVHHMGREADALDAARRNVDAWMREIEGQGLDAILVTASGCGTTIKDYGFMLREDADYAEKAARVSALAMDISEYLAKIDLPAGANFVGGRGLKVAYHPACSLQHGQKVTQEPRRLLEQAGYAVHVPAEAHLCCGSAGTYNILQAELAGQLGQRKADAIDQLEADVIATGNVGCATQIARFTGTPIVHTVELLDWATGGPFPAALTPALADRA